MLEHGFKRLENFSTSVQMKLLPKLLVTMLLDIKKTGSLIENWALGVGGKDIVPSPISKSHLEKSGSAIGRILCFNLNI